MIARRSPMAALVSLCLAVGVLVFACASAQATDVHAYLSQITEIPVSSGAPSTGPLDQALAMTVDSGHLWEADRVGGIGINDRVNEYDTASGAFLSQLPQVPSLTAGSAGAGLAV